MKKAKFFSLIAFFITTTTFASDLVTRLGVGTTFPASNSVVTHFTPFALEFNLRKFLPIDLALEASYGKGNHAVSQADTTTLGMSEGFNIDRSWARAGLGGFYSFGVNNVSFRAGALFGVWHVTSDVNLSSGTVGTAYTGTEAPFSKNNFYISPAIGMDVVIVGNFGYYVRFDVMTTIRDSETSSSSFFTGDSMTLLNGLTYQF